MYRKHKINPLAVIYFLGFFTGGFSGRGGLGDVNDSLSLSLRGGQGSGVVLLGISLAGVDFLTTIFLSFLLIIVTPLRFGLSHEFIEKTKR
jgi:hypothetical protein